MKIALLLCAGAVIIGVAPSVRADTQNDWAACMARVAPISARNWIALGKLSKKMDPAIALRSTNLAMRLTAMCAGSIAPGIKFDDIAVKSESVWRALSKILPATATPDASITEVDPGAFMCKMYFIPDDLSAYGADPASIPEELKSRAPLQIGGYEVLRKDEPLVRLTSAKQSDGRPVNLLRKCQRISQNGTLGDA